MDAGRWRPWRVLRERSHLQLRWALLPPGAAGGRLEDRPSGRTIVLDPRLGRRRRAATLAHELVHDERGILYLPGAPPALVAKEEAAVERIVVDRLLPPSELASLVARRAEIGPVMASDVADEFDVTTELATVALRRLRLDRSASGPS